MLSELIEDDDTMGLLSQKYSSENKWKQSQSKSGLVWAGRMCYITFLVKNSFKHLGYTSSFTFHCLFYQYISLLGLS